MIICWYILFVVLEHTDNITMDFTFLWSRCHGEACMLLFSHSRWVYPALLQRRAVVRCSLCMRHCLLACSIALAAKGDIWWLMCSHVPPLLWAADALHRQIAEKGDGEGGEDGQTQSVFFVCVNVCLHVSTSSWFGYYSSEIGGY